MPCIKIRLSEDDQNMVRNYAEFFGKPMTTCIRDAFLKEYKKNRGEIESYIQHKNNSIDNI